MSTTRLWQSAMSRGKLKLVSIQITGDRRYGGLVTAIDV